MTSYGVNIINRFDLLSDEAPVKPAAPAVVVEQKAAPAAKNSQPEQQSARNNNYSRGGGGGGSNFEGGDRQPRGDRGRGRGRGRGGRGGGADREHRERRDGESNPNKREFDHHVSRTEFTGNHGRGGGRGGRHYQKAVGNFDVHNNQSSEAAIAEVPAAADDEAADVAPEVEAEAVAQVVEEAKVEEEEDKTLTLAQWQELQKANAAVELDTLNVRRAGEDVTEDDFQSARELKKKGLAEEGVLGLDHVSVREAKAGKALAPLVAKESPIEVFFSAPSGGRGRGRGGRGGYNNNFRGPRQAPVNISNARDFPALGK